MKGWDTVVDSWIEQVQIWRDMAFLSRTQCNAAILLYQGEKFKHCIYKFGLNLDHNASASHWKVPGWPLETN